MAAPMAIAAAIGAGLGVGKHFLVDKPEEERSKWMLAQTQRLNPWTGLRGEPIKRANLFNSVMQGGVSGLSMGQNLGMLGGGAKGATGAAAGGAAGEGLGASLMSDGSSGVAAAPMQDASYMTPELQTSLNRSPYSAFRTQKLYR